MPELSLANQDQPSDRRNRDDSNDGPTPDRPTERGRIPLDELLAEFRARFSRLAPAEAFAALQNGATLLDTRCADTRVAEGTVPGSQHVPLSVLLWRLDPASPWRTEALADLDREIILMCDHGYSSSLAAGLLVQLGFTRVADVAGGFEAWRDAGLPVEPAATRSADLGSG